MAVTLNGSELHRRVNTSFTLPPLHIFNNKIDADAFWSFLPPKLCMATSSCYPTSRPPLFEPGLKASNSLNSSSLIVATDSESHAEDMLRINWSI